MEVKGQYAIQAPKETVFAALVDPDVLARCMPGCETLTPVQEGVYEAKLKLGVAAVRGEYLGKIEIVNPQPPDSVTLKVSGEGGPGFMKATAAAQLEEGSDGRTVIQYEGTAEVGGMIAGVGQRVLGGIAKLLIGQFFKALDEELHRRANDVAGA